jgi:DNA (cytosine-5)-methyltransferase 1
MNEQPTHLDLFSGIGGFSLAFEAEGFKTIGFAEIDPYASAVLKKHWPNVPNYGDVRDVPTIQCSVITGGLPCQPFSVAGKRRGSEDDRHLWPALLSVIGWCEPEFCLLENVPGIIGMELDNVLSDLEGIHYATRALVVPAAARDARHIRQRVWILANAHGPGLQAPAREQLEGIQETPRTFQGCEFSRGIATQGRTWTVEPKLGRVANGIPNRVDRIRCLGNAIVPQVAQIFARAIYQQITGSNVRE